MEKVNSYRFLLILTMLFLVGGLLSCSTRDSSAGQECLGDSNLERIDKLVGESHDDVDGQTIDLVVYDAFLAPEGAFEKFEIDTGIKVNILTTADTGTMVSQAVLTSGDPIGDVMFGVDNTFLCRALLNDVFIPYTPTTWSELIDELKIDSYARVVPVDYGDICVNYWKESVKDTPRSIDELRNESFKDSFVTQNPETSAPGMGFLLATIGLYGEDEWENFWIDLRDNGLKVRSGWSESYYGDFVSGGGDRPLVTSYATSPIAEYIYSAEPILEPPTAIIEDSCFRSIEFIGILRGTDKPIASALLVDFMTSQYFQELIPESNFVLPANSTADLPLVFTDFLPKNLSPVSLSPDVIEMKRNDWTERWTQIVLR